jgi:hypothetical protein
MPILDRAFSNALPKIMEKRRIHLSSVSRQSTTVPLWWQIPFAPSTLLLSGTMGTDFRPFLQADAVEAKESDPRAGVRLARPPHADVAITAVAAKELRGPVAAGIAAMIRGSPEVPTEGLMSLRILPMYGS